MDKLFSVYEPSRQYKELTEESFSAVHNETFPEV